METANVLITDPVTGTTRELPIPVHLYEQLFPQPVQCEMDFPYPLTPRAERRKRSVEEEESFEDTLRSIGMSTHGPIGVNSTPISFSSGAVAAACVGSAIASSILF